jgi:hypothetical protein
MAPNPRPDKTGDKIAGAAWREFTKVAGKARLDAILFTKYTVSQFHQHISSPGDKRRHECRRGTILYESVLSLVVPEVDAAEAACTGFSQSEQYRR